MVRCLAVLLALLALTAPAGAQSTAPKIAEWINRQIEMPQAASVLKAPEQGADSVGTVRQGALVRVLGVVAGGEFLQIRLPDGKTLGYLPRAMLQAALEPSLPAPPRTEPAPKPPAPDTAAASPMSGPAKVVDTGSLIVDGRMRSLAFIQGLSGSHAKALQGFIDAEGGVVTCEPADPGRFTCRLANGTDLAMAALVNGSALTVPGAPDRYQQQQDAARAAHRGLWQAPVNPAQPLPVDNVAPASPSVPGASFRPSGRFLDYALGSDTARPADCGLETAWRGGTARLALDVVSTASARSFVITLHDDGWDLTQPLGGRGEIVVDRASMPVTFEHGPGLGATVLTGRMTNSADATGLLQRMRAGTSLWVTSPLGRTPALSLSGASNAIDALARCLRL